MQKIKASSLYDADDLRNLTTDSKKSPSSISGR